MPRLFTAVCAAGIAATVAATPQAAASAASFCGELGGRLEGPYCHALVRSERHAVRDVKVAIPEELIDDAVVGPDLRTYLTTLVGNWRRVGVGMAADSFGEGNYQIFRHGDVLSLAYRETYHADGPDFNNAYRTFTYDMSTGRRLELGDLTKPGTDPRQSIPPLAAPFVQQALDEAQPPHQPGSYPFVVDRWTPDEVYSGGYKAWVLGPDELILYMPDYPVGHDTPLDYTPGMMQWSMDGGAVIARIPLTALSTILRPEFGGS